MELMGTKEAGKELGVSGRHVTKLIKQYNDSHAEQIGQFISGSWVLTWDDLEKLKSIPRKRGNPEFGTKYKGSWWRRKE